jgi:hypothetical protein
VTPALSPVSTSRRLIQLSSVCGLQPTLPATDSTVAQCEPYTDRVHLFHLGTTLVQMLFRSGNV